MIENDIMKAVKLLKPKKMWGPWPNPSQNIMWWHYVPTLTFKLSLFKHVQSKENTHTMANLKNLCHLKKVNPSKIETNRPISNLCLCSKIFEKLIL